MKCSDAFIQRRDEAVDECLKTIMLIPHTPLRRFAIPKCLLFYVAPALPLNQRSCGTLPVYVFFLFCFNAGFGLCAAAESLFRCCFTSPLYFVVSCNLQTCLLFVRLLLYMLFFLLYFLLEARKIV